MYCKNCMVRHRRTKIVFYCKIYKRYIDYRVSCENCPEFILVRNKPIKKVSKKRVFVKEEIYQQVYERDKGKCQLQDETCEGNLQLHHIVYKSENKNLINEPTNCIMLCTKHHKEVHSNKHYWQEKLIQKNKLKNF